MADGRFPMADFRWPMADGRFPMAEILGTRGSGHYLCSLPLPSGFGLGHWPSAIEYRPSSGAPRPTAPSQEADRGVILIQGGAGSSRGRGGRTMAIDKNAYRVVLFEAPDDPQGVRDLLCAVSGIHPTDAMQW